MKWRMLCWKMVCTGCSKEFGLKIDKAMKHGQRKGHRVTYAPYIREDRHN